MSGEIQKQANPQGKGSADVVNDLRACAPTCVQAKSIHQWLADYFTSTLILGAEYGFKPVVAKDYYLYFKNSGWKLSLIEPRAWKTHHPGTFFAICKLNSDMCWSVELAENWQCDTSLLNELKQLEQSFLEAICVESPLLETLPFFMRHLSYYQRLGANALARSLKQSLEIKVGKQECMRLVGKTLISELTFTKQALLSTY